MILPLTVVELELLKIVSNFSIAGALLVTAVTIARKEIPSAVGGNAYSGSSQTIDVRIIEGPSFGFPVKAPITGFPVRAPIGGLPVRAPIGGFAVKDR